MSDALETVVEQQPILPVDESPIAEPAKEPGLQDEKSLGPAGSEWRNGRWVNPLGKTSRFAEVRKSLEQSQRESEWLRLAKGGNVRPTEEQDPETWAFLRNKEVSDAKLGKLTPPDFGPEQPADGSPEETPVVEPTPEEVAHNAAHDQMQTRLRVRLEAPEVQGLVSSMEQAVERGATPLFFNDLGHFAANYPNGEQVLFHLGANPQKLLAYSMLSKGQLRDVVNGLSKELSHSGNGKPRLTKAPTPPSPVGARATATAFDVNDEQSDPEEWARLRNEQVAKRRGR